MTSLALPNEERKGILSLRRCGLPLSAKDPPKVYLLLSGFPDPLTTFDSFVEPFEEHYHVVKICYPGMESNTNCNDITTDPYFWGYPITKVRDSLVELIQEYRNEYKCTDIYLHGFDWGALVTLMVADSNPELLTKLVQQDIGLGGFERLYDIIAIISYQTFLITLFLISRASCILVGPQISTMTTDQVLKIICRFIFPWYLMFRPSRLGWCMLRDHFEPTKCHAYFQIFLDIAMRPKEANGPLDVKFTKTVSQFFAYSSPKYQYVRFYSKKYLAKLDKTPGCQTKVYPTSHWMHHEDTSCQEDLQRDVMEFFNQEHQVLVAAETTASTKKDL